MNVRSLTTAGVAVLAIAVPAAQAAVAAPDTGSASATAAATSVYTPAAVKALAAHEAASERSPVVEAPAAAPDDRGGVRGIGTVEQPSSPVAVVSRPSGFDWGDMLIGVGATLLVVAGVAAARRYTPRPARRQSLGTS